MPTEDINKIAVVGSGRISAMDAIELSLHQVEKDLTVIDKQIEEEINYLNPSVFIPYRNFYPLASISNGREFICKGKHQYRQVGNEWICQCGRKIND